MSSGNLKELDTHFAFGDNWASYAKLIDAPQIEEAEKGLLKLIPEGIEGRSFLDIGCGSGLHALAAARLGAKRILATDIDPMSVATTRRLLSEHATDSRWQAEQISVFDLDPDTYGRFAIVYSWGVLHHSGDMWGAVRAAAALVEPGGLLVLSLYRTTRCDALWKAQKRWYAKASPLAQRLARAGYISAYGTAYTLAGRGSFRKFVANYKSARGMDFYHDVHDWLGGYPYETALAPEVDSKLTSLGFRAERIFARPTMTHGLLGSGCDEYVYRASP
jgi:2-polyprenyl-3-methyl-5-hydroxy-6-metoxy-1,4-benzoquinol methylase